MKGNWPWILMVLANLIFWIALQQRNTTIVYYLTYNLDRKDLVPLINSWRRFRSCLSSLSLL